MSFARTEKAIRQRLAAHWIVSPGVARTPIIWENLALDANNASQAAPAGPWLMCEVTFGNASQASLGEAGSILWRATGMLFLHCFTPINTGKAQALALADQASQIFRGQCFSGVLCRATSLQPAQTTGAWLRVTAQIPFQFDDLG